MSEENNSREARIQMQVQKISGKVVKRGRKWLKIVQEGRNEKYPEDLLINSITENLKEGDTFEKLMVETVCKPQYVGGYKFTHTATSEEILREKEINRWWGYVKKAYEEDKRIYSKGIQKLHELNCYDYDAEILEMEKNVDVSNAIYWIRRNYKETGRLYKKGIEILKKYDVHSYDAEINTMRRKIEECRKSEKGEGKECCWQERADGYNRLDKGVIVIRDNSAVKVLSSHYDNSENSGYPWSIYEYRGIDVTSTEEGKKALDMYRLRKEKEKVDRELQEKKNTVIEQLKDAIKNNDVLNKEKVPMPVGTIVYDSRNAYGGGICIVTDNGFAWYIVNNSTDGDDWTRNHICGAGYGYKCNIENVQKLLEQLQKLE